MAEVFQVRALGSRCAPFYTDPVANLTLSIDGETLRRARIRALEQGTSVNALIREYLQSIAGNDRKAGIDRFLEIAATSETGSAGTSWIREELYEERLDR